MYTRNVHNNQQNSRPVDRPFIISHASHRDIYECKSNDIGESCTPPMREWEKGRNRHSFGVDPFLFIFFLSFYRGGEFIEVTILLLGSKKRENLREVTKESKRREKGTRREINDALYNNNKKKKNLEK